MKKEVKKINIKDFKTDNNGTKLIKLAEKINEIIELLGVDTK